MYPAYSITRRAGLSHRVPQHSAKASATKTSMMKPTKTAARGGVSVLHAGRDTLCAYDVSGFYTSMASSRAGSVVAGIQDNLFRCFKSDMFCSGARFSPRRVRTAKRLVSHLKIL